MSGVLDLLNRLAERGIELSVVGRLIKAEGAPLTDADRQAIRQHKHELFSLLRPSEDDLPPDGRLLLGWIDSLGGALTAEELSAAVRWPTGAVWGLLMRLRAMRIVRQSRADGRWHLTDLAERFAAPRTLQ